MEHIPSGSFAYWISNTCDRTYHKIVQNPCELCKEKNYDQSQSEVLIINICIYNPSKIFAWTRLVKTVRVTKNIWRIITSIGSIWHENMLGYLSLDIICPSTLTVFLELCSQNTVRFLEQILSADKYPYIFSRQMVTVVYIFQACFSVSNVLKAKKLR